MNQPFMQQQIAKFLFNIVLMLAFPFIVNGQTQNEVKNDNERTFMPTLQLGYVAHGTNELAGGLMTQTSIEYRDISSFIFRINYDVFNSSMNLEYPVDSTVSFTGRTTFSEVIIGIGYRQQLQKHNITAYIQPGIRFYGYPDFTVASNQINLDYDSRNLGMIRYSIGYEYEITPKLFIVIEGLLGHTFAARDFWVDNRWSYGATVGISAPL
ncbi:MAG: hypothetical protein F6K19_27415 [Cyanothece sp. SIO1E1]|nr:hypothetical protein [Cyanothece sp. SIO1E1]